MLRRMFRNVFAGLSLTNLSLKWRKNWKIIRNLRKYNSWIISIIRYFFVTKCSRRVAVVPAILVGRVISGRKLFSSSVVEQNHFKLPRAFESRLYLVCQGFISLTESYTPNTPNPTTPTLILECVQGVPINMGIHWRIRYRLFIFFDLV